MKKTAQQKKNDKQLSPEQLGKMLVDIYESGYLDRKQAYKMSFVKGIFRGLGSAIGATIVLALLFWILSLFQDVPLVGRLVNNVRETVNTQQ